MPPVPVLWLSLALALQLCWEHHMPFSGSSLCLRQTILKYRVAQVLKWSGYTQVQERYRNVYFSSSQMKCFPVWELKRIDLLYFISELTLITQKKPTTKQQTNFNPNVLKFIALKVQRRMKQATFHGVFAKTNPDWQGFTNINAPLGHL